ncbi:MAG: nucleotidyl transferase AbiEii/AbiGii toxin family protein, partial [Fibrobacter sp.]|nr:nucleotidyl transferase AbiEii/AbiGii toxin family protein [Fibrobacter sp.]
YKAIYQYPNLVGLTSSTVKTGKLLIEINTYANPYPYVKQKISSFISEYLTIINRQDLIEQYNLSTFEINVLEKRRTLVEKLVSLIRFSFEDDVIRSLSSKIRHFYDLYYLSNDKDCMTYLHSIEFTKDLSELLTHDQQKFNIPKGWQLKDPKDSPLLKEFPALWTKLSATYQSELTPLAFSSIPNKDLIAESFIKVIENI